MKRKQQQTNKNNKTDTKTGVFATLIFICNFFDNHEFELFICMIIALISSTIRSLCVRVCVVHNMTVLLSRFYVIHFVDCVKCGVLTILGEICHRNDRYRC